MLFTKEITKITYQDVVEFCNQRIAESINLDYKKDFPRDLEKSISAFANTTGGLIIIGVEEEDSKPKLPKIPKIPSMRPIKPIAPIGYKYVWREPK
ncbi:ATP-binding protein [Patescibacteria group bacterium]|nr:ATP-binding protein [Patescibacteria group bacterium]